jgi:hypothetical protein
MKYYGSDGSAVFSYIRRLIRYFHQFAKTIVDTIAMFGCEIYLC